jgi:hypothetical protein
MNAATVPTTDPVSAPRHTPTGAPRRTATAAPECLPGCTAAHPAGLGFTLCDTPLAAVALDDRRALAVSVTRVAEPGQPTVVTVAVGVVEDGEPREPAELSPDAARRVAHALNLGAELAEQSLSAATDEAA